MAGSCSIMFMFMDSLFAGTKTAKYCFVEDETDSFGALLKKPTTAASMFPFLVSNLWLDRSKHQSHCERPGERNYKDKRSDTGKKQHKTSPPWKWKVPRHPGPLTLEKDTPSIFSLQTNFASTS